MKKHFIAMACILAALVSCQKDPAQEKASKENQPIKVTLTATIGGDDTKISFADEDNVIKTAWELYDKVSLIALDISGNVLTNDIFTATSAGKVVEFDGEFSNNLETNSVYIFYPALTEGEGTEEKPWQVPADNAGRASGPLYNVIVGESWLNFAPGCQLQKNLDDCSHLEQYAVLSGKADLEEMLEGKVKVTLEHRSYVVKVQLTLPKEGLAVHSLQMAVKSEDGAYNIRVSGSGWTKISEPGKFPGGWDSIYNLFFGEDIIDGTGAGLEVEGTELTAYVVAYAGQSWEYAVQETTWYHLTSGDYYSIQVGAMDDEELYTCVLDKKTVNKDITLENGKMYRLSATLEKQD